MIVVEADFFMGYPLITGKFLNLSESLNLSDLTESSSCQP